MNAHSAAEAIEQLDVAQDATEAKFLAIFETSGYALVELEIIQKLCEVRDQKRLEEAIGFFVNYGRTIAKDYRALQALSAPAAATEGGANE
jgi:hypothetical protein